MFLYFEVFIVFHVLFMMTIISFFLALLLGPQLFEDLYYLRSSRSVVRLFQTIIPLYFHAFHSIFVFSLSTSSSFAFKPIFSLFGMLLDVGIISSALRV